MDTHQLIDSLTSHLSLYHLSSPNSGPSRNSNPRSSILKWFSSLSVHHRQAHLTTVDPHFTRLLLRMRSHLLRDGHGFFFLLPDLPSTSRNRTCLPGICFRKSRGLLARAAQQKCSERSVYDAVRLFGSQEGESGSECCCSCSLNSLNSMTMCEDFVTDVDRFVGAMDAVSNGEFLRGEESALGADWAEMKWLKAKGYYSIEAFVVNRLEVALRLAWLNFNNGKKRGVKLKEKASTTGVAANVFWRKKGCLDWWGKLDGATRRKVYLTVMGKAAKSLTEEILKGANSSLEDEMWLFSVGEEQPLKYNSTVSSRWNSAALSADVEFGLTIIPTSVSVNLTPWLNVSNKLHVLRDIVTMMSCPQSAYNNEKMFFSTLGSVTTISDCVLRKLRGILMIISLDCTKIELLGEGTLKSPAIKPKETSGVGSRRKKGRTRNTKMAHSVPTHQGEDLMHSKHLKDQGCILTGAEHADLVEFKRACVLQGMDICKETLSSAVEMENAEGSADKKVQTTLRKNRKGRIKNKNRSLTEPAKERNIETIAIRVSSSGIPQGEAGHSNGVSDNSIAWDIDHSTGGNLVPSLTSGNSSYEGNGGYDALKGIQVSFLVGSANNGSCPDSECDQSCKNQVVLSKMENSNHTVDCNMMFHVRPVLEDASVLNCEDINFCDSRQLTKSDNKSLSPECPIEAIDEKGKTIQSLGQGSENSCDTGLTSSIEHTSYEWPAVQCAAPVRFPSANSRHLPAATDRLHLDAGRNWHNHFRQAYLPAMHQGINPPTEGGCGRVLPRQLPLSLDWPPMVRSSSCLAPSMTYNDSGFFSRRQSSFWQGFATHSIQLNATNFDEERKYSGDFMDLSDLTNSQELADEFDNHWVSEEEFEVHAVSGMDYNQYFGGGVMYWNPSDHPGTGFSRPPSLSSEDSSWPWHEADLTRAVDDMVAFSSSYSTNGLTSPTAASFCSPFDPLGPGHQALGYVMPGNEAAGKLLHSSSTLTDAVAEEKVSGSLANLPGDIEGKVGDSLPYPILRPIIVPNMSRERSRSEFKWSHDHRSPCVPHTKREQPRIKRPPSPVVLCVPRAPRPPPPSPVSDTRKHKGFPTVRSGSSSPRHWGMRGWYQDGTNFEEFCVYMDGTEVVWPSWRNKNLSPRPMIQPLPGPLLQDHLVAITQLARDQEHPDVAFPLQPLESQNSPIQKASLPLMHSLLHEEIDSFCKRVAAENMIRKPFINWAVKRVTRSLQVLWPRSRTNIFGSNATGLSLPTSDVDLVVCLPPVRNLEPIKEAGILEGRNGIKETCLQHAARYLANQEWVKNDSLKTVENTAIPIIMLVVEVPHDLVTPGASSVQTPKDDPTPMTGEGHLDCIDIVGLENSVSPKCSKINCDDDNVSKSIRLDISFKSPSHTGIQTTELVKELTEQFPAVTPLALVLKQFLADRSLDQAYSGGLSSYCLVLLIVRFLQHEHHLGRPINQNFGSLLMDFLYFFGNVFDPRQMRISVQGSGIYINRERGCSIDPIHIDDPLFPSNNVGRNCFRIHQCIKAFADACAVLENELTCLPDDGDLNMQPPYRLLPKIIPSFING